MDFPNSPILPGVLFRTGLTDADYDEAIQALLDAKEQPKRMSQCCTVCHDTGHLAHQCHHNPLVMARRAIMAAQVWRCFHCGFVAATHEEAEAHFTDHESWPPVCLWVQRQPDDAARELQDLRQEIDRLRLEVAACQRQPSDCEA